MNDKKNIMVAMSGGVDSSTAAFLLKEQGYETVGVTLKLWHSNDDKRRPGGCCSTEDISDARRVCNFLGIRHYVLNMEEEFKSCVVDNFAGEYLSGRTPNPCIVCNEKIKFGLLMQKAGQMNFDYFATGHYARVEREAGSFVLKKGLDQHKDQSYVLYRLGQSELSKLVLPLGAMKKPEVREIAQKNNIPAAHKPESQEICFVDDDYADFLSSYIKDFGSKVKPGEVVNSEGKVLGKHKGLVYYTVGQRSGLGISYEYPLYVVKLDTKNNSLVVGRKQEVYSRDMEVEYVSWVSGKEPALPLECDVKIRYLHRQAPAVVSSCENGVKVNFKEPQMAITPGQSAVFYRGETALGGGLIK
ncbi:MAG TPA: tRNA 2-thiouridine(34) synthase MnmA [Elusimicrobia bacterium]|nr:MAG: tRNA 2-thiouridine(34) synthase MnmA [Elusimicrobia bacterium RIFOXYA12_FULL_49_49]OGS10522.1 MAG: tRNA 2-thiouridine(34) synthase MnmA [Elusimicrobia bacterium RIFOXYB1_FULL_48_9]OGS14834.1 MAG: tRNA 2-thiouridine(34) synthase MnmA [Elusimicrobia bacterium RIFOXYA2_FULL_47_53]OGS25762.1 MAG: tRNA 2-thiouridine(34) synthase MnmA [Elusimicrobia bacterium RIFOXYB12_FULL_50_12]OGS31844.1 MAG: tRNA 2-thiouridine(34) synthase MnmA [Elusimicrobia bacterium RIFOXYB2_FULL_46_23]HBU69670.1 tRNA